VIAVLVSANGGKPGQSKSFPRPHTKYQEIRAMELESKHKKLVARVLRRPTVE
jgi:hypothetical protein